MNCSLNFFYESIGISKQSFHQHTDRYLKERDVEEQILFLVYRIRTDHPTMGLRDMYYKVQPQSIGRDKFEALCKRANLSFERKPNYRKTTDSSGVATLAKGKTLPAGDYDLRASFKGDKAYAAAGDAVVTGITLPE